MAHAVEATEATAPTHGYGPPVAVVVSVRVTALAFREADGRYSVTVPALPGCVTCADTIDEVQRQVRDVVEGILAIHHDDHRDEAIREITEPMPGESTP